MTPLSVDNRELGITVPPSQPSPRTPGTKVTGGVTAETKFGLTGMLRGNFSQ
jgi:hypothetical protein